MKEAQAQEVTYRGVNASRHSIGFAFRSRPRVRERVFGSQRSHYIRIFLQQRIRLRTRVLGFDILIYLIWLPRAINYIRPRAPTRVPSTYLEYLRMCKTRLS